MLRRNNEGPVEQFASLQFVRQAQGNSVVVEDVSIERLREELDILDRRDQDLAKMRNGLI